METPIRLFFSYAHEDEAYREELEAHLSSLRREGIIEQWHDRNISAGSEWSDEIDTNLDEADIILLLVSADFINSDYCYGIEMTRALERHDAKEARVIPVILRSVVLDNTPFARLQALPKNAEPITKWADRDEAFANVARGILQVCKELKGEAVAPPVRGEVSQQKQTTPEHHHTELIEEARWLCKTFDLFIVLHKKHRRTRKRLILALLTIGILFTVGLLLEPQFDVPVFLKPGPLLLLGTISSVLYLSLEDLDKKIFKCEIALSQNACRQDSPSKESLIKGISFAKTILHEHFDVPIPSHS